MTEPRTALARLRAEPRAVGRICDRFGVDLLTAFGSAVRDDPSSPPHDLDLAARRLVGRLDVLGMADALAELTGCEHIDLMDLRRANPLARSQALELGALLHESTPGLFTRAVLAAMMERMDTAWLRQLNLQALAGRQ